MLLLITLLLSSAQSSPAHRMLFSNFSECNVVSREILPALSPPESVAQFYFCLVDRSSGGRGSRFDAGTLRSSLLRNPQNANLRLYHGSGPLVCNTNNFGRVSGWEAISPTSSSAVLALRGTTCSSTSWGCCTVIECVGTAPCAGMLLTEAYLAPEGSPAAPRDCGRSSQALDFLAPSGVVLRSCPAGGGGNFSEGTLQAVSVANPNMHTISVLLTGGQDCQLASRSGSMGSYAYAARTLATTAATVAFPPTNCTGAECCLLVFCEAANGAPGCTGLAYSRAMTLPPAPDAPPSAGAEASGSSLNIPALAASAATSALGILAGLFFCWRCLRQRREYEEALQKQQHRQAAQLEMVHSPGAGGLQQQQWPQQQQQQQQWAPQQLLQQQWPPQQQQWPQQLQPQQQQQWSPQLPPQQLQHLNPVADWRQQQRK